MVTSNGKGRLCHRHWVEAIREAAMRPVYFHGNGYGQSLCFLCGSSVEFYLGLYAAHVDVDGRKCDASGHEIAVLRKEAVR
jgi:hypothetical protein